MMQVFNVSLSLGPEITDSTPVLAEILSFATHSILNFDIE